MSDSVNQEKLQKLREPFPPEAISQLPKGGTSLSYVGHANITDRILNVDPLWYWEPFALDERGFPAMDYDAQDKPVGLWIRLTICGVTRIGYGTCEARKNEPIKELIGDALRNAAMRFGMALELWSKAELESQHSEAASVSAPRPQNAPQPPQRANNGHSSAAPACPKCHGPMWNNLAKKADGSISAKSPDFKCKNKEGCDGVIWPDDNGQRRAPAQAAPAGPSPAQMAARNAIPMTGALPVAQLAAEYDADDSDPFGGDQ